MKTLNLKTSEDIECIRESALIVSKTLGMLAAELKPGISTLKPVSYTHLTLPTTFGV